MQYGKPDGNRVDGCDWKLYFNLLHLLGSDYTSRDLRRYWFKNVLRALPQSGSVPGSQTGWRAVALTRDRFLEDLGLMLLALVGVLGVSYFFGYWEEHDGKAP
jgi:hypothetical protein